MLVEGGADVNARETAMGQTPLMFAAAYDRVDVVKLLLARGADVAATSKVVDLAEADSPEEESGQQRGRAQNAGGAARVRRTMRRCHPAVSLQRAGRHLGRLLALHFAVRQGHADVVKALVEAGADVNQLEPGRQVDAAPGGHDQRPFRHRHVPAGQGREPEPGRATTASTPLYGTLNLQWAPKSLYPQPRAYLQQQTSYLD